MRGLGRPPGQRCIICNGLATPLVWGPTTERQEEMASTGKVVLAGPDVFRTPPTHVCSDCGAFFHSRLGFYVRHQEPDSSVFGVSVWPTSRRKTFIEWTGENWIAIVEGKGSMLLNPEVSASAMTLVFTPMTFEQRGQWAEERGIKMFHEEDGEWLRVRLEEGVFLFHILILRELWRMLGPRPVPKAIRVFSRRGHPPIWLANASRHP